VEEMIATGSSLKRAQRTIRWNHANGSERECYAEYKKLDYQNYRASERGQQSHKKALQKARIDRATKRAANSRKIKKEGSTGLPTIDFLKVIFFLNPGNHWRRTN
jgi:hypothetical protein